ncbi:hypothetical protein FACS1894195_3350 [Bacteroidia bacterium]|nr:hypothetical protein FACS1894195_3350 [Bacteroidia bacterium]
MSSKIYNGIIKNKKKKNMKKKILSRVALLAIAAGLALAVSCNSDKFSQVELGLPVPLKVCPTNADK